MGFLEGLKNAFKASDAENRITKKKMEELFLLSLQMDQLNGYQLAYGKHMTTGPTLGGRKHIFYNYVIGFKPNPATIDMVIVPVNDVLDSYGTATIINNTTLKKAGKTFIQRLYKFKTISGETIVFHVPPLNGKTASMLGNMEIVINQEEEAAAFKDFFQTLKKSD